MKAKIILYFSFVLLFELKFDICKAQNHIQLNYEDFGISFIPKKSIDTLYFDILEGRFKNFRLTMFLYEIEGKCFVKLYDKKNKKLRAEGMFNSSGDTLKKYNYKKVMGMPRGKYAFKVTILEYRNPLKNGKWIYYNEKGEINYETVYIFERQ